MNRKSDRPTERTASKRKTARRLLERLLGRGAPQNDPSRGRLLLEPLESRQMLAGDVDWLSTDPGVAIPRADEPAGQFSTASLQAEGEASNDLVAFAQALSQAGVTYYGAAWCPFCTQQRELFEDGGDYLPFVEVTNPDRTLNEIGEAENITSFPTWEFPDNTRATGVLSLAELSQRAGVEIPQSDQPTFATVGNQVVEIGSPLHVPINAYDPDSADLTVTVSVADPSLLEASVLENNRSAHMTVKGWGTMVFELFEDRAPRPTARFIELAQAGFFDQTDTNSITFHRVLDNFVLQGGDPTGTGSGGSDLGDFDDQYHPELQHNRTGVLSYAKSLDDTNDSQFFITEGEQRHLDFNHSIFGQLVEGEKIREAISETAVTNSRPDVDVVIESVEIVQDNENSMVMLKPTGAGTGETDVTITVTDGDGNTYTEVMTVTIIGDQVNANPYLPDIAPVSVAGGGIATFPLNGVDIEGDPIAYEARVIDGSGATATVDQATGEVTVTPADGYSGEILVEVAARKTTTPTSSNPSTRSSTMDLQVVPVNVGPQAPTGISLDAASDTGVSDSDGITNTAPITFTVTGVVDGATVEVLAGDTQIGVGLASGSTVSITTNNFAALGNASHIVSARQTVNGITSARSSSINVTYDTVAPEEVGDISSQATVGVEFLADLQSGEEGQGLRYALVSGPSGLTIGAETGVVSWTPTSEQVGDQTFTVRLTDAAGNAREQQFTVNVGAEPLLTVRLEITDLNGNVLQQLVPGQEFEVRVYGNDERLFGEAQGIYALYLDMLYDSNLAEPAPFTPAPTAQNPDPQPTVFTYDDLYNSGISGEATAGLLNEVGAFSSTSSFLGPGERFMFSARLRATNAGTLVITSDPAEDPGHEVALFNIDDAIEPSRVTYGSATIDIAANFTVNDDTASVNEDSVNNDLNVLANDTILNQGTTLTITSVSGTSSEGGTVSINGQNVRYTPPADFFGTDTLTYTVTDQDGNSQTGTVTVTVQAVNDPPTANNDTIELAGDTEDNRIDVLDNDTSDPDSGETLRVTALGLPSQGGTVRIGTGGTHVLYTPEPGFVGTETFTYTLSDGTLTDTATVTVAVTESNPPPIAVDDSFTVLEDAAQGSFDVLANDSNPDTEETFGLDSVISVEHGTASINQAGDALLYQPAADFFGTDLVVYQIRDSNGATAQATVTFTVSGVNDPPPAPDQSIDLVRGSTDAVVLDVSDLQAINVDGSGEALTITGVGATTAGGTVQIDQATGQIKYTTPNATFTGPDSFTYTIEDAEGSTTTGTLSIEVLDYQPRDFTVDITAAGVIDGFSPFGDAYRATLRGTTVSSQTVEESAPVDPVTGEVRFENQAPGSYEVTFPGVPFLDGDSGDRVVAIESSADDVSPTPIPMDFGRLAAQHIKRRDYLASAPKMAGFVIVAPGQSHMWLSVADAAGMPQNVVISMAANGQSVTIETDATSGSGRVAATLPLDSDVLDHRASEQGYELFHVNLDPAAANYQPVASASGEGEGSGSLVGEGEGSATSAPAVPTTLGQLSLGASASLGASRVVANSMASNDLAGQSTKAITPTEQAGWSTGQSGEGEAGPLDNSSQGSGEAIARDTSGGSLDASGRADANFAGMESTDGATAAVDAAMQDVLPSLERRSMIADALAEDDTDQDAEAVDQWFSDLSGE